MTELSYGWIVFYTLYYPYPLQHWLSSTILGALGVRHHLPLPAHTQLLSLYYCVRLNHNLSLYGAPDPLEVEPRPPRSLGSSRSSSVAASLGDPLPDDPRR
jgi:hypothetical protein